MTPNGYRVSFWGDENVLKLDSGDGCKLCELIKPPPPFFFGLTRQLMGS